MAELFSTIPPKTLVERAAECIQICKSSHEKRSKADTALGSWGLSMLLWPLQPSFMQHFQGQAQGQAELLRLPNPFNPFFSLFTSRTQTQFVSQETLPQNFCGILIPRQQLGFQTRTGSSQNL